LDEAELIGLPLRLVIGDKSRRDGFVDPQFRNGRTSELVALEVTWEELLLRWRNRRSKKTIAFRLVMG